MLIGTGIESATFKLISGVLGVALLAAVCVSIKRGIEIDRLNAEYQTSLKDTADFKARLAEEVTRQQEAAINKERELNRALAQSLKESDEQQKRLLALDRDSRTALAGLRDALRAANIRSGIVSAAAGTPAASAPDPHAGRLGEVIEELARDRQRLASERDDAIVRGRMCEAAYDRATGSK